jgi:hypothetical protein
MIRQPKGIRTYRTAYDRYLKPVIVNFFRQEFGGIFGPAIRENIADSMIDIFEKMHINYQHSNMDSCFGMLSTKILELIHPIEAISLLFLLWFTEMTLLSSKRKRLLETSENRLLQGCSRRPLNKAVSFP